MNGCERPITFRCEGEQLVGIVTTPAMPRARGVVVVVGGPQYRAGSHRQFTYLCRGLSGAGIPSLRFDYRGMGDADGEPRTFEAIDADIRAAVDAFHKEVPAIADVVLWGLCDAATASVFYSHKDARVSGLVLANPWVRTTESLATTHIKSYYRSRITDPNLWRKLAAGDVDLSSASRAFLRTVAEASGASRLAKRLTGGARRESGSDATPLPDRMSASLERFRGRVLLIRSGQDLTAQEFNLVAEKSALWRELLAADRVACRDLPEADHTFSTRLWRDEVTRWTSEWLTSW